MKKTLIAGILIGLLSFTARTDCNFYVNNKKYNGVIFCGNYPTNLKGLDSIKWSPSLLDIQAAEQKIDSFILSEDTLKNQYGGPCPVIKENMSRYYRQYLGLIENGRRIIWVNFIYDYNDKSYDSFPFDRYWLSTGACSRVWQIKVDVNTWQCYGFALN